MIINLSSQIQRLPPPTPNTTHTPPHTATPMNLDSYLQEPEPDSDRPKKLQHLEAKTQTLEDTGTNISLQPTQQNMAHTTITATSKHNNE